MRLPSQSRVEVARLKMSAKLIVLFALFLTITSAQRFKVLYEWNYVNFTWPTEDSLRSSISKGEYIPENNIISGLKYYDGYFYITLPRMKQGVPATLTRIPAMAYENDTEPLLEPYPNWEMNKEGECDALQNVQNVEIDTDGKMWILDAGRTETMTKLLSSKCKPRLLIYDIKDQVTVSNYYFPESVTNNRSYLYDLVIDDVDGGYAYITDNSGADPGIIVFSLKQKKSWKIRDNATMRASPDAIEFRVSGTAVSTPINLAGIALGTRITSDKDHTFVAQDRNVYFCPLSSTHLYRIESSELRNENNPNVASKIKEVGTKSSQSDGIVMDENGVLYYGLLSDNSIATWNSKTSFGSGQKVIAKDPIHIQWPDCLSFDDKGNLLVVTNRLQKFIYGQMNLSEPNFRILEAAVNVKSYLYGVPKEEPDTTDTHFLNRNDYETEKDSSTFDPTVDPTTTNPSSSNHMEQHQILASSAVNVKNQALAILTILIIFYLH